MCFAKENISSHLQSAFVFCKHKDVKTDFFFIIVPEEFAAFLTYFLASACTRSLKHCVVLNHSVWFEKKRRCTKFTSKDGMQGSKPL